MSDVMMQASTETGPVPTKLCGGAGTEHNKHEETFVLDAAIADLIPAW